MAGFKAVFGSFGNALVSVAGGVEKLGHAVQLGGMAAAKVAGAGYLAGMQLEAEQLVSFVKSMGYNVNNLEEAQTIYSTLRDFDLLTKEQVEEGNRLFSAPTAAPTVAPTAS